MLFKQACTGFTIIELMVALLIFTMIAGALFGVLAIGNVSWQTGETQVQVQQEGRRAMDSIARELSQSTSTQVNIGAANDTITFRIPVDWDGDGDVYDNSFNIDWGAIDNNGVHQLDWQIRYYLGGLNNRQLLKAILNAGGGAVGNATVLGNNVQSVSFVGDAASPQVVDVAITAQRTTLQQRNIQYVLQSRVDLRN